MRSSSMSSYWTYCSNIRPDPRPQWPRRLHRPRSHASLLLSFPSRRSTPLDRAHPGVVSEQRDPDTEVPEAPTAKVRTEAWNGRVVVVIERPEVTLCAVYIALRPVPPAVPATRRRGAIPTTRWRRAVPITRSGARRRAVIPTEPSLSGRTRCAVVGCTEAARRIPGTTHLRITAIERSPRRERSVVRATGSTGAARATRATGTNSTGTTRATGTSSTGTTGTTGTNATGTTRATGAAGTNSTGSTGAGSTGAGSTGAGSTGARSTGSTGAGSTGARSTGTTGAGSTGTGSTGAGSTPARSTGTTGAGSTGARST